MTASLLVDEHAIFAATAGASFDRQRAALKALQEREPSAEQNTDMAHEAVTSARAFIQGLRGLGEGARTL